MSNRATTGITLLLCLAMLAAARPSRAQDEAALGFERTPPRLSFTDGEVSFLRPGGEDWSPALVNTALAAGDELYTAQGANLELQIGARAFVRAGENTQLGLTSLEPDFLQLRVTSGHLSLDLRSLKTGQGFEIDTPNAAFTIERSGYYRVAVDGETTSFTTRRGGRATVTPASGDSVVIAASEQVVVSGTDAPQLASYAAPELDAWDRWNYARTDDQLDAVSARYVPSGVYGADDLDQHGDWRVVPSYGAVWMPRGVAAGWAPYTTGRWIYDPYYAWTWVDSAPWGWAPYHYGRWVRVASYWGWCPGPIVARPYYSPALVAFYGGGGFDVGITFGRPRIAWVPLGWGEPVVRWWGPARYRGSPYWAGWGGPRVVNKVVIKHKTVIKGDDIRIYQNADVRDAIVGVDRRHFGRRDGEGVRYARLRSDELAPLRGGVDVKPDRSSFVGESRAAQRPPRESRQRPVVATREPRSDAAPGARFGAADPAPRARVVQPPREGRRIETSKRPPFGTQSDVERSTPRPAPRFESERRDGPDASGTDGERPRRFERPEPPASNDVRAARREPPRAAPPAAPAASSSDARPRMGSRGDPGSSERARRAAPSAPDWSSRASRPESAARELPGEPANRVYRPQAADRGSSARASQRPERAPVGERGGERSGLGSRSGRDGERSAGSGRNQRSERAERHGARTQPEATNESGSNERGGFGRR